MTSNCHNLIIFLMCLLNVVKIRAQCEVPRAGDQRVLTPESIKRTYSDGDTAMFQCSVGYKPVHSKASRTVICSGNKWDYSSLKLKCTKKRCGPLPDFANGHYTYSPEGDEGILFGATAIAQCNEGYQLLRYTARRCLDVGWDGRMPVCEVVKCSPPPEIPNGQSEETLLDEYEYGQAVTYICNAGYTRFGVSTVSCSNNGTFEPSPPECIKVSCDPLSVPNGKIINGIPPYGYKSTVAFACDYGFKMEGSGSLVCDRNGWDSPPPTCTEKTCGPLPDLANGRYTYSPEGAKGVLFGATATAQCNEGYQLLGYKTRHCLDAGWDGRMPVCKAIKCLPPPEILNGQSEEPLLDEYNYGQAVTYICNAGYTRFGVSTVSCSNNGIFAPSPPECRKKTCGPLPDLANGRYTYSPEGAEGVLFGATATAQCNEGYQLLGYKTRHCLDAGWDGREPVCEVVKCPPPPEILNGQSEETLLDEYEYGQAVTYICNAGFTLSGVSTVSCSNNGTFEPSPPECRTQCGPPSAGDNRVLTPESNKPTYSDGETATFQCSDGYEPADPEASKTITCSGNKWDYSTLTLKCTITLSPTAQLLEIEREKLELSRERLAIEKERLQLDRERLAFEKERLQLDRERLAFEKERLQLDRERPAFEKERLQLDRERLAMEKSSLTLCKKHSEEV